MDLDAAQAAVERACEEFKSPATAAAASALLLQFRSSSGVLQACRHILDRSHSLDARFHAASALRDAVVREWGMLGSDGRTALRSYLMSYLMAHAEEPAMQVVRATLVSALAVLLKRGWLEEGETPASRAAFFMELNAATAQAQARSPEAGAAANRLVAAVMEAVVVEFALATASPLGLPLEYHARCASDLQHHFLQDIFRHAVGLGRAAAAAQDGATCAASLSLMAAVLGWDFRRSSSLAPLPAMPLSLPASRVGSGAGGSGGSVSGTAPSAGADWAALLLAPETLDWVAALLGQLAAAGGSGGGGGAAAQELVARARGVVVALCNISADVFPREAPEVLTGPGGGVRGGYLRAVLRCVAAWVAAPREAVAAALAGDELPLWEACKAILALASSHPPRLLEAAGQDVLGGAAGGGGGFLALLQALTLEVVRATSGSAAQLEQWVTECRDMLVESWALMVQRDGGGDGGGGALRPLGVGALGPPTLPGLAEGAAAVFAALTEAAMTAAGQQDDEEDDVAAENEAAEAVAEDARMAEAAALARAAPAATFPLLAGAMAAAQQQLLAAAAALRGGAAGADVTAQWVAALERLCWLVRMAAHCLADSGAGETPLMPLALSLAAESGGPAVGAVQGLTGALLALPALALQDGAAAVLSPRLMEAVVWALARWADTYLFPEEAEGLPAALVAAYATRGSGLGAAAGGAAAGGIGGPGGGGGGGPPGGGGGGQGEAVVDGLARLAATCLVAFPGEAELHTEVCTVLLPVLSRRRSLCCVLLDAGSWAELCGAFAARRPQLTAGLAPKLQRWLSQSLCQAACGFPPSLDSPHNSARLSSASHHHHHHRPISPAAPSPAATAASAAATNYITQLLAPTVNAIRALAASPNLSQLSARADVAAELCGMLEVLRGGACRGAAAGGTAARAAGWAAVSELLSPLLALQRVWSDDPRVSALLLKLASAVVEHHVAYLQSDQAHVLMAWVLELLQQYRRGRAARVSVAAVAAAAVAAGGRAGRSKSVGDNLQGLGAQAGAGTGGAREQAPGVRRTVSGLSVAAPAVASSTGAATLREEDARDSARELRALLQLLTHITQRDVALASAASDGWASSAGSTPRSMAMSGGLGAAGGPPGAPEGGQEVGVAQVVLAGLDVLLPLLTPELLAAATTAAGGGDGGGGGGGPGAGGKLARLLFSLLAYMMEVHTQAVVNLPPPHFATLLSCLEAGARGAAGPPAAAAAAAAAGAAARLGPGGGGGAPAAAGGAFDGVVVQSALEGIAGLAKYHQQSVSCGGRGFGAHCAPAAAGGGPLTHYLVQLLMHIVLMGDVGTEVVELAGDALLPLLTSDPSAFAALGTALVQSQADPHAASQVAAALGRLVAAPDGPAGAGSAHAVAAAAAAAAGAFDLSRLSRRAFRERVCAVVSELRGIMRVR